MDKKSVSSEWQQSLSRSFRTDLAWEEITRFRGLNPIPGEIDGVKSYEYLAHGIKVNKIELLKEVSGIDKTPGNYYTIDLNEVDFHDSKTTRQIEIVLMEVIKETLNNLGLSDKKCLVVGLGNVNVTPDSLGPYVLDNIVVTRHLHKLNAIVDGYGEVSAITPGVMGNTGIETFDIISSVVKNVDIDYLLVVDALAAGSLARVNKTIQVTDSGISPGSGVGNKRKELSHNTLGIPVIAIGVPTVVDATTIVSETINLLQRELISQSGESHRENLFGQLGNLSNSDLLALLNEVLSPRGVNMMVTPKEVDADIEDLAKIISAGIDYALHDSLRKLIVES